MKQHVAACSCTSMDEKGCHKPFHVVTHAQRVSHLPLPFNIRLLIDKILRILCFIIEFVA